MACRRPKIVLLLSCVSVCPAVAQGSAPETGVSEPSVAKAVYNMAAGSVFRIEAGLGHGTGFLIDSDGLILTNDHVIGSAEDPVAFIEPTARFRVEVVLRDPDADLALVRVHARVVAGRHALPLADSPVEIAPGDRIIALGFPLNQPLTMSSGMVANVRPGAILIDALVNPGNSGGPVLSEEGIVVAVTTFVDQDPRLGPGLGGAVLIDRARYLIAAARANPKKMPDPTVLAPLPLDPYPVSTLKTVADTIDPVLFTSLSGMTTGPFAISLSTPLAQMLSAITTGRQVGKDRRNREERANVPHAQRYSDVAAMRDWHQYVGDLTAPVVTVKVEPMFGETDGSAFRRGLLAALVGADGKATVRFQGDVRGVTLRRNGQVVEPLRGGHAPVRVAIDNELVDFSDVADFGYYVYAPEVFRPDAPQRPPEITLEIHDLKSPRAKRIEKLTPAVIARAWNDFEAYFTRMPGAKPFLAYSMTRSCAVTSGAAAMGGVAGTANPVDGSGTSCTYVISSAGK